MSPMPVLTIPLKPTFFDTYWPARSPRAPRVALLATGGAAVAAASTVPLDKPGIGWFAAAVAIAVALVVVAGQTPGRLRVGWLVAGLALMAVGGVRASEWLFVLCVMTACGAASLAVTGGRSVRALAFGVVAVGIAAFRALPWAASGLRTLRRGSDSPRIGRSVLIAVALFALFGSLLAGADEGFGNLLGGLLPDLDGDRVTEWIFLFTAATFAVLGAVFVLANPATVDEMPASARKRVSLAEWALPVGVVVALFTAFVGVQLAVLFGGSEYVLTTADLTYAQYARSGFWQLLAVTLLTLVVLAVAARVAPTDTAADRLWLRALLGALAVLTLVIVVSAMGRLWTYQQTYGFTVLRLLVGVCEIWLGIIYVLVLVAGVRLRGAWVPQAVVGTAVAMLIGLAALDPERFIADRNVARYAETGDIDTVYLSMLSEDVVPALAELPEPLRACALRDFDGTDEDTPMTWNLSRAQARTILATMPRIDPYGCGSSAYR
ncbi:DUF4153 domain-containing protein [Alloactinosynnema sp. L-07]|uniref:DUF4153 domain-containing protein n=1 Tax=Alloactinosynnema sp. L-07 TaxID=1653480 RepID=UPI0008373B03|nr:DUF4173 domain-containing protein [Alloactinosynnema sp. L-07]